VRLVERAHHRRLEKFLAVRRREMVSHVCNHSAHTRTKTKEKNTLHGRIKILKEDNSKVCK
jgi:hypothetical protein